MYLAKHSSNLITFMQPDFEFTDDRGGLTQLVNRGWNQCNYITSKANSLRGNHFHIHNREAFFIISGKFILTLMHGSTKEKYLLEAQDFFAIEKRVMHSFAFIEETSLISLYDIGVQNTEFPIDIHTEHGSV